MEKTLTEYEELTLKWSKDRGITINGKVEIQALKLVSEVGELCDNIAKGASIKDDIGDCLVVLTNIAKLKGTTLSECWEVAYEDIKDRKGFLNANGTFIKSTDKNYAELLKDFEQHNGNGADENAMIIVDLSGNHLPDDSYAYNIGLATAKGTIIEFRFNLDINNEIPANLPKLFIGKSVAQLKAYLKTIGEIK